MNTIIGSQPYGPAAPSASGAIYTSNKALYDILSKSTFSSDKIGNVYASYDSGAKNPDGTTRISQRNVTEIGQSGQLSYRSDDKNADLNSLLLNGASILYSGDTTPASDGTTTPSVPVNQAPAPANPTAPSNIPSLPAMGGGGGTPNLGTNSSGNSNNSGSAFTILPGPAASNPLPSAQDVIKQAQIDAQKLIAATNQQDIGYQTAQDTLNNKKRGLLSTILAGNKANSNPLVEKPSLLGQ